MDRIIIRKAEKPDYSFILQENEDNVVFLSPLSEEILCKLEQMSEFILIAEVNDIPAAFLIAFGNGTDYDSENYRWFSGQYDDFLYIDRVVVDDSFRHLGVGKKLYDEVFEYAQKINASYVTAEVDLIPFNGISLAFHKSMGFREVGIQTVRNGTVKVSLLEAPVKRKSF